MPSLIINFILIVFVVVQRIQVKRLETEISYRAFVASLDLVVGAPIYEVVGSLIYTSTLKSYKITASKTILTTNRKIVFGLLYSGVEINREVNIENDNFSINADHRMTQDFKKAQSWVAEFYEEKLAEIYNAK